MKCENCGHVNQQRTTLPNDQFDAFWKAYPRKVGKFLSNKIWKTLKGDELLFNRIMESLERHRRSTDWIKDNGVYIPHPSTWLNQKRWEDDVPLIIPDVDPRAYQGPSKEERMQVAKEKAEALMEIEYAKRQAMKNAAIRDELRTQRMQDSYGG